jgi:single stranded DNA-binding protein
MSLASVSIVGNLVRAPEQFSFQSGRVKVTMTVAVNRINKDGEGADFYKVEAWGKLGELSTTYLSKGDQIATSGKLAMQRWTDKEGKERITPTIVADQIAFPRRLKPAAKDRVVSTESGDLDVGDLAGEVLGEPIEELVSSIAEPLARYQYRFFLPTPPHTH